MSQSKYLIIGLGNIGPEYHNTRHNIGFDVLDVYAKQHNATFTLERLAQVAHVKLKGNTLTLIKPTTYMNLSGKAFAYWQQALKIETQNTLTVVDDLALPLATIRVRPTGTDAGHNGLKDIAATLHTTAYPRLRFGIGNNFAKGRQVEFVLGHWAHTELIEVSHAITKATEAIDSFVLEGLSICMNKYSK
jgi:PTH1 family peptidyl-tRNA hydrolase